MAITAPPNAASPMGVCSVDATSGLVYSPSCANYTSITTAGTTTIKSGGGLYFGAMSIASGTSYTLTAYDVQGTNSTQLIATATAVGGSGVGAAGPSGLGVRFGGSLVIVTAGTPGSFNALWD